MDSVQRRPVRAFIFTPIIFLLLFGTLLWLPSIFDVQANDVSQSFTYFLAIFVFGLPVSYLGAVLIGIPAYFLMKNTKYETVITCVITTALIAAIVYFFLEIDILPSPEGSSFSYGDSGGKIVENSKRTDYGWKVFLFGITQVFLLGAISGLIFWRLYSGKWQGRVKTGN
ncbi:hypothetical protein N9W89_02115 [Hellea sp.]|nr:hypothetical protein [Hellea sp.]